MHTSRPELVIFDYDGVLCRAEAYTPDAIRMGLRRFGESVGVDIPEPDEATLLGTLGYPSFKTYPPLLPAPVRDRWHEMHQFTLDAMEARIRALGTDCLYAGALDLLRDLLADGRILGLASNSSERYQRVHRETMGLDHWFRHLYHAQLPGIECKADMVRAILAAEPTAHSAIMVGDRAGDREAAVRNGLPFLACTYGFGCEAEYLGAIARADDIAGLRTALGL